MPKYTFTFKKDDILVEFTTADKDVVERQFRIWVLDADDYVNNRPFRSAKAQFDPIETREEIPVAAVEDPIIEEETTTVSEVQETYTETEAPQEEEKIETPVAEQEVSQVIEEATAQEQPQQSESQPEILDKASTLLRTINSIQNEPEEVEQPVVEFEKVLEESIENPTFEPDKPRDQIFLNLLTSKKTTDKFHYLMITAFYLSEFEKLERFSLKQINAKLMQNLSEVIDHAMLQEAINQGLVELVPDLTGGAEVAEYRLTPAGEEFFAKI